MSRFLSLPGTVGCSRYRSGIREFWQARLRKPGPLPSLHVMPIKAAYGRLPWEVPSYGSSSCSHSRSTAVWYRDGLERFQARTCAVKGAVLALLARAPFHLSFGPPLLLSNRALARDPLPARRQARVFSRSLRDETLHLPPFVDDRRNSERWITAMLMPSTTTSLICTRRCRRSVPLHLDRRRAGRANDSLATIAPSGPWRLPVT